LLVASSVAVPPQLSPLTVPAAESIVVVPDALQFQVGEVLKLLAHCVASTLTEGGTVTWVQQTPAWHIAPLPQTYAGPQPPHALGLVCSLSHEPLHWENPALHVNVHALLTHAGCALATVVVHEFAHAPQLPRSFVVSTQLLPQRVGMPAGQLDTHIDPEHSGVPPLHAWPHIPQWLASFVVLTQAPAHKENPPLHVKLQTLATQAGRAFAMLVVQALLHEPQFVVSLVVSTQVLPHRVGVAAGQPAIHAYVPESPPALEQVGLPASHVLPQRPQLSAFVKSTHAPLHWLYPPLHANVHPASAHAGCAWAMLVVQAWPHAPQWFGSVVSSTHVPPHCVAALGGQLETHAWPAPTGAQTGIAPPHALPHAPQLDDVAGSTQPPWHARDPNEQPPWVPSAAFPPPSPGVVSARLTPSADVGPSSELPASQLPLQVTDTYELSPLRRPHAATAPPIAAAPTRPASQRTLSCCARRDRHAR
jgi:hypothetical protein